MKEYVLNDPNSMAQYMRDKEKEIAELKENWRKDHDILTGYNLGLIEQLAQAKEIIKKLYSHIFQGMDFMELNDFNVLKAEAEQFLNGENIILEDAQAGNSPFDADEVFNKEMKAYPKE